MTTNRRRSRRSDGRLRAGGALAAAFVLVLLAGCSGDDGGSGGAVPTLLTVPGGGTVSTTSTTRAPSTTTSDDGSTSAPPVSSTVGGSASPSTAATTTVPGPGDSGQGSASTSSTSPSTSTSSTSSTSTTIGDDIEPPPPSIQTSSTAPVSTVEVPPDTIGGGEADYLFGPTSLAGVRFGAKQDTVLTRMKQLLGDPLSVQFVGACPTGDAYAYQWLGLAVIVTDQGLAYYLIAFSSDEYVDGGAPVPGWRTASGLAIDATLADVQAKYPGQVTLDPPDGATPDVTFEITAGPDAGIAGQAHNGVLESVSAGSPEC